VEKLDTQQLQAFITGSFASDANAPTLLVESVSATHVRLRMKISDQHLRPGASVAGPFLMGLADTVGWALILSNLGVEAAPSVTSNLNISFLARAAAVDLIAEGELLKLGKRLSVSEVRIFSEGRPQPVAQATVTYAVLLASDRPPL
jgi:uncharacterized protein (TIGR00369 family)